MSFSSKIKVNVIDEFVTAFTLGYYQRKDRDMIADIKEMITKDAISKFCIEVTYLYLLAIIKDYSHDKIKITKNIRESINSSKGNWKDHLKRIASCYWYGFSFTEVSFLDKPNNRKQISEMVTYDPQRYDFVVKSGKIKEVSYKASKEILVPYDNGIHLVTGSELNFDYVFGCGRCEAAIPYWELHKIVMPVVAIAAQRQATPILVKKTNLNDDVVLLDETGSPLIDNTTGEPILIKKGHDAVKQLAVMGSSGVTAIDLEDDLYSINLNVSAEFLMGVVRLCEQYRMSALMIPHTLFSFSISGTGDSNLSKNHLELFRYSIKSMAVFLSEELVEKLIRPLITFNFGEQEDYGAFTIDENDPTGLEIAKVAISALGNAKIADTALLNRIRKLLGVEELPDV